MQFTRVRCGLIRGQVRLSARVLAPLLFTGHAWYWLYRNIKYDFTIMVIYANLNAHDQDPDRIHIRLSAHSQLALRNDTYTHLLGHVLCHAF